MSVEQTENFEKVKKVDDCRNVRDLNLEKILIVWKKPRYDIFMEHTDDKQTKDYMRNEENKRQMRESRDAQTELKENVMNFLQKQGLKISDVYRGDLTSEKINSNDCIITLGGDGTVLEANSFSINTPILGINTDKRKVKLNEYDSSEGFYCAMSQENYEEKLKEFLDGEMSISHLMRLEAKINGKQIRNKSNQLVHRVLNEISVGKTSSGSSVNYVVKIGAVEEYHNDSGMLIANPQSVWPYWSMKEYTQDDILPIDGNAFQAVARDFGPKMCNSERKTMRFIVENASCIEIISKNPRNIIEVDGAHKDTTHLFGLDSVLQVYKSEYKLPIMGFDKEKLYWYLDKRNFPITRRF